MNLNLKNKNALVCGSTQGIGWASAVELALMGANVILFARNEKSLQEQVNKLESTGDQKHSYLVADFDDNQSVKKAIARYLENGQSIHILINNTGGSTGGNIIEEDEEKFRAVFEKHLINNQTLVKAVFPGMKAAGFGRIVNVISVSVKQPILGLGVSNTVRWAVACWAKTLSKEIGAFGITVNNVLPGLTETQRLIQVNKMRADSMHVSVNEVEENQKKDIPIRRFAKPEEVAAAVAFLCSDAAGAITGINLPVDGGLSNSL
jgi:3-oxoacyl-[acyl-carrier protein] reductase